MTSSAAVSPAGDPPSVPSAFDPPSSPQAASPSRRGAARRPAMTDRRVRGVGTSRSSGKLTCKVRFSVYGEHRATLPANKQVRRVRTRVRGAETAAPEPPAVGHGVAGDLPAGPGEERRGGALARRGDEQRRRSRAWRPRPRRRRAASGRCPGCGGRRRRRGRRRSRPTRSTSPRPRRPPARRPAP